MTQVLEVLVCTCNDGIVSVPKILLKPRSDVRYLVSHQIFPDTKISDQAGAVCEVLKQRADVRVSTICSVGLSRNRNNALKQARGDFLLIADDDIQLISDAPTKIVDLFNSNQSLECFTCRIRTPSGELYKMYKGAGLFHNKISIMGVSSIEVVVRRSTIEREGVLFDERFGLGSIYPIAEEAILLGDMLRKNIRILRTDIVVAVHDSIGSGQEFGTESACRARGALFRRSFGWLGYPLLLLQSIKRYPKYKGAMSITHYIRTGSIAFFKLKDLRS